MSNAEMHGESEPSAAVTVDFVFKVLARRKVHTI